MKTIAIVNRKGGVAKTTTAVELAYILVASCGKRVLLADADPQGDATGTLLPMKEHCEGMAGVLGGADYYEDVIEHTEIPHLDIIPAGDALAALDLEYMLSDERPSHNALRNLRDALIEDDVYDFMVIDCPPNYSASCISAIVAADYIIIPTNLDKNSALGMTKLVEQIDTIRARQNPNVRISGCLVTRYHRCDVSEDAVKYLRETAPVHVFDTVIRQTDKVTESSWAFKSVQAWSPFSGPARDYRAFVAEFLAKEGLEV